MKISRRDFIHAGCALGTVMLLSSVVDKAEANARHGYIPATSFNGGKTQFNTTNVQAGGSFAFINLLKHAQDWGYSGTPTGTNVTQIPIRELNANGYPTSIPTGATGYVAQLTMPTTAEYSGQYILNWPAGSATMTVANVGITIISGSSTSPPMIFTLNATGSPQLSITATSAALTFIQLCKYGNDNTPYGSPYDNYTLLQQGKVFDPQTLALVKSAKPGAIRSLGWGGYSNGTNESAIALWAHRPPRNYYTYCGIFPDPSVFIDNVMTNSGNDYTIAATGFALTNKVKVIANFNAASVSSARTNVTSTTTATSPIVVGWGAVHGLAIGNTVVFGPNLPAPLVQAQTYFIIASGFTSTSFEVSATSGGSAVLASSSTSYSYFAIAPVRININGTGLIPVTALAIPIPGNVFTDYGTPTGLNTLVYDATLGYYLAFYESFQKVNTVGVPPEVFVDYCAAVGAHPHIVAPTASIEPVSDFMTSWASYATSTYPWMKPRIEPPNETWNSNFFQTQYAEAVSYTLWGTTNDVDNAYGKWASTLPQAMYANYGNDRTKYTMLWACMTDAAWHNSSFTDRLNSTKYVAVNGGQAAYKWCDRATFANYFSNGETFTVQELINAYNYSVTFSGNPSQQAVVMANYTADCSLNLNGSLEAFNIPWAEQGGNNLKAVIQALPGTSTFTGITCYEGGYDSNQNDTGGNWTSTITGGTNTTNCIFTLSTSFNGQGATLLAQNGNTIPAVAGMQITLSGLTGGYATFNGQTVNVTSVSGSTITTNLDASGQGSAFSGSATATYVSSQTYVTTLRVASKQAATLGVQNKAMNDFVTITLSSSGFVGEFPSNFIYTGSNNDWTVLDPDIYAPLNSNWNSIVAYNA
jgi:hypothetical protein